MSYKPIENPFQQDEIQEIPLDPSPLIRVISQVRFPSIVSIEKPSFIAAFQEELRQQFPILESQEQTVVNLSTSPDNVERKISTVWRFFDNSQKWRITLTQDFLALETINYTSRSDFKAKLSFVLQALSDHIKPSACLRIGTRYIDLVKGEEFKNIENLIQPNILGIYQTPIKEHMISSLRHSIFEIEENIHLASRWGVLPKGQTYDPGSIDPLEETGWILDIDVFDAHKQDFACSEILSGFDLLATYAHKFFRWVVTEEFLKSYGGKTDAST